MSRLRHYLGKTQTELEKEFQEEIDSFKNGDIGTTERPVYNNFQHFNYMAQHQLPLEETDYLYNSIFTKTQQQVCINNMIKIVQNYIDESEQELMFAKAKAKAKAKAETKAKAKAEAEAEVEAEAEAEAEVEVEAEIEVEAEVEAETETKVEVEAEVEAEAEAEVEETACKRRRT
jgi:hypothetical protein